MTSTFARILQFWKPHRLLGAGLIVTMILRAVFSVVLALAIKLVIDAVIDPSDDLSAVAVGAILLAGLAVSVGAGLVAANLAARATADIIADVRTQVFDHLQRLPLAYHEAAASGDLIAHFSSDIAQLSRGVIRMPLAGLRAITAMALYLPVMFILDPRLAAVSIVAVPASVWLVQRFAPASKEALDEEKEQIASVLEEVSQNLSAQKILRTYGMTRRSRKRFTERISDLRQAARKAEERIAYEQVIAEYAVELTKVLIILVGVVFAFAGTLDPGSFAAFAAILTEFSYQASVVGMEVVPAIKQSDAGIRRIDRILDLEPEDRPDSTTPVPDMKADITFDQVTFQYPGSTSPQLHSVSTTLPGNHYVAVVGRNGSGKSSFLNVLLGFYQLSKGSVGIDQTDINTVNGDDLRRHIGVAFQDTLLLPGTIEENVAMGFDAVDPKSFERTAHAAGLDIVIDDLEDGARTSVGSQGLSLSGGEAQRIGIARAMLGDPDLLLLDEVASGLDPASEAALLRVIENLRGTRTIINVTHRLQAARVADTIVVLDDGRLVEQGSFHDLLDAGGPFCAMWEKQQGFEVSATGRHARIEPSRLRRIPLFEGLGEDALAAIAATFDSESFDDGEAVFDRGAAGDGFYVIARGVVEVLRPTGNGEVQVAAVLEDGDFFGEMALLTSDRRNATVRSRGVSTLLRLDRNAFDDLLDRNPDARALVERVADERRQANAEVR
ncbi:MAG: ABC transporter transmembrane domain-containing protein [Acidimicrobiia bacterium]